MKKCPMCNKEKDKDAFNKNRASRDGLCTYCQSCRSSYRRTKYENQVGRYRSENMKKLYGLSIPDYNAILISQGGKCAICKSTNPNGRGSNFHVDHDHSTGKIRALLCVNCNTAIGLFHENTVLMEKAIEYLKKHSQTNPLTGQPFETVPGGL